MGRDVHILDIHRLLRDGSRERLLFCSDYASHVDNVFSDGGMRRFEIGVGVKAGLEFMDHYRLSVGYDIQLNSMVKGDDYYNQVVSVSVGYMF